MPIELDNLPDIKSSRRGEQHWSFSLDNLDGYSLGAQMSIVSIIADGHFRLNEAWSKIYRKRQERAVQLVDRFATTMARYPQYIQTIDETHPNEQGEYPEKGYDRTK